MRRNQRGRGDKELNATTQDRQGTGTPVEASRGGGDFYGVRQREEGTLGREKPGVDKDRGTGQGRQEEATGRGKVGTARARNSFCPPGMGGKRRQTVAAGGQERRPGGQSLRNRARGRGGETCANRERIGVDG